VETHLSTREFDGQRFNFLVNRLAGLIAYSYHPKKPALDLNDKGLTALPQAIFSVELTLTERYWVIGHLSICLFIRFLV
jgi:hypothetical protein